MASQPTLGDLLSRIEALEARVQEGDDYRALINLQCAYGYYVVKCLL